jgi:hypothetical protein
LVWHSSLYREFQAEREEILRHKWIESEKAGYDIGFERALTDWILKHRSEVAQGASHPRSRILQHSPVQLHLMSEAGLPSRASPFFMSPEAQVLILSMPRPSTAPAAHRARDRRTQ